MGWNPNVPSAGSTTSVIAANQPGHVYTGLAIGSNAGGNRLYAADFANGAIDVYDGSFAIDPLPTFADPTIPTTAGNTFHPFNIQNLGGSLYVTYAKVGTDGRPENGIGNGFVRRFNTDGVRDLTFGINNGALDAPWGVTIASATFGIFGSALLIGNFSDVASPSIHAYNPSTGGFLGTIQDQGGNGIHIDHLWALEVGNDSAAGDAGAVYFTAGIGAEQHGLLGSLRPTTASANTVIEFSAAGYSVNEAAGTISVTVLRSGDTSGIASVRYAALPTPGTGHAGASDFTLAPGTLNFAVGQTSGTFVVGITNDAIAEVDETLELVLSNPTGAGVGLASPSTAELFIADGAGVPPSTGPLIPPGSAYIQANLVSDVSGVAFVQDPLLINPWGIAKTGTSPFWVANNGTATSTLYREDPPGDTVVINPGLAAITIPGGLPTGVVANSTADFVIGSAPASGPASFLFASITGNIVGWNPNVPSAGSTAGVNAVSQAGHVYTGLAIGSNAGGNRLYAADFANGAIDVYDGAFAIAPVLGAFADPTIPTTAGNTFHPFNIQNLGGSLYVTYAKVGTDGRPENGVGNGFVRRFNTDGVRDLTFGINNGALDAPWGVTIASATFGIFGSALLIGNSSDVPSPSIHAYNPSTGAFLGTIQDQGGNGIHIDHLWALEVGNGVAAGDVGAVYFTAGFADEADGLFGSLRPTTATANALIRFSADAYSGNEAAGALQITVVRLGDTTGAASVRYAAFPGAGSSQAGAADFTLLSGVLSFAPGETSRTFVVGITNDVIVEGAETLELVLSNATGAGLMSPDVATLTIVDDGTGVIPAEIPTLSQWALSALAATLAMLASWRLARNRRRSVAVR